MNSRLTFPLVVTALLLTLITGCTATSSPAPTASTPAASTEATAAPTEAAEPTAEATEATVEATTEATATTEVTATEEMTAAAEITAPAAATTESVQSEVTATVESSAGMTSSTEATGTASAGLANPASQNCVAQGGTLTIATRGDGGEYGICTFEDNRQCEEWSLFRGQCPVGGLKITGYLTPAAQFCAITGGTYTDNGTTSADDEKGVCAFTDGKSCPAADYYNGMCTP